MIDLKQKNSSHGSGVDLPDSIVSFHVDHNLQADAQKMAHAAGASATRFKAASHVELRVRWGEAPFPPRPRAGEAVESLARNARYQLMFDAMVRRHDVHVLATGHHADDQVETVLMRLGAGSSILGLGGMRPLRRFGMALGKGENDFGWFGHEGLNRWIVRPLLEVSKDRILATCDLHHIHYVLDRTNFQPELTLRNAIRHVLARNEQKRHSAELVREPPPSLPPVLADQIMRMKTASENLKIPVPIDLMSSRQSLREAVRCSSRNLSDIEAKAPISTASPSKHPPEPSSSPPTSCPPRSWTRSCNWRWSFVYCGTFRHSPGVRRVRRQGAVARACNASSSGYGTPTRLLMHVPGSRRAQTSSGRRLESAETGG